MAQPAPPALTAITLTLKNVLTAKPLYKTVKPARTDRPASHALKASILMVENVYLAKTSILTVWNVQLMDPPAPPVLIHSILKIKHASPAKPLLTIAPPARMDRPVSPASKASMSQKENVPTAILSILIVSSAPLMGPNAPAALMASIQMPKTALNAQPH